MVNNRLRPFQRLHNGLLIYLEFEDWPKDIPLPEEAEVTELGDGLFRPYWDFVLESDKTVEKIVGWFIFPNLTAEETLQWYQVEMERQGWIEVERSETLPDWAMLRYRHPETEDNTETYVVISIRHNKYLNRTQPMIRRVTIHPYSPPEGEDVLEAGEETLPAAEGDATEAVSGPTEERFLARKPRITSASAKHIGVGVVAKRV